MIWYNVVAQFYQFEQRVAFNGGVMGVLVLAHNCCISRGKDRCLDYGHHTFDGSRRPKI